MKKNRYLEWGVDDLCRAEGLLWDLRLLHDWEERLSGVPRTISATRCFQFPLFLDGIPLEVDVSHKYIFSKVFLFTCTFYVMIFTDYLLWQLEALGDATCLFPRLSLSCP